MRELPDVRQWRILDIQFIETSVFVKQVDAMLSEGEYRSLQLFLCQRPDAGAVIPGTGGLRKLRWRISGRGKRGGARVIYYWRTASGVILLLYMYRKTARESLTPADLRALKRLTEDH